MCPRSPLVAVAFLLAAGVGARAHAGEPSTESATKEIARLNHEALDAYQALEFDVAKAKLLRAVKLAEDEGLQDDRILARTYLHLGATYLAGYLDNTRGLDALKKALRVDPKIKMTTSIMNRSVLRAFERAQNEIRDENAALDQDLERLKRERAEREVTESARAETLRIAQEKLLAERAARREANRAKDEAARKAGEEQIALSRAVLAKRRPVDAEPEPVEAEPDEVDPRTVRGLKCPTPAEMPANRPLALRCALDNTTAAAAVFTFYRSAGREDFTPQIMKRSSSGWWETVVPSQFITAPAVEIYFQARDPRGKPVATDGNLEEPRQLVVKASGAGEKNRPRAMARPDSAAGGGP